VLKLDFFDISFRTAYAEAKDLALAQSSVPLLTPGTLQTEIRGGNRFVYRYRYDAAGKRITEYLGADQDPETRIKLAHAEGEIRDAATISDYSKKLRKLGFHGTGNSALITIATLFNAGLFGNGALLVGTHAFGAILNEIGVALGPLAMTEDVDIARATSIQIAALPRGGLLRLLAETGLPFFPVPQLDHREPPTSFKVRGQRLIVDLLVPSRGEAYQIVPVPELGAHATGLPHLKYLLEDPVRSILLGRDRIVPVVIPNAGRYCIHKLAVFAMRRGANPKGAKDLNQAAILAAALTQQDDFMLTEAIDAAAPSLKRLAKTGAKAAITLLGTGYPAAANHLAAL